MNIYFKATAGIVICLFLYLLLPKESKSLSVLMTIAACCAVLTVVLSFFVPVMEFAESLIHIGNIDAEMVKALIKSTGVCLISEFTIVFCKDAGNATLGKAAQILTAAVLMYISIPYLNQLMKIVENLLGEM